LPSVVLGAGLAALTLSQPARAQSSIFWDGRDAYTLFDRHPVDRQLFDQREAQPYRVFPYSDRFAALADLGIGTQQIWTGGAQTRFHGYFIADTYGAVRLVPGLEANLNLLLLNPSASDGYRVSSAVFPGLALHVRYPLMKLAGDRVRLDVVGPDLGWVTLGRGLLIEQTPLEGLMSGLTWRDMQVRYLFAGRGVYDDDDIGAVALSLFGGRVELTAIGWQIGQQTNLSQIGSQTNVVYGSAAIDQPLGAGFRVAVEGAVRAESTPRGAAMLRIDYMHRQEAPIAVHTGYQMRFYSNGFGAHQEYSAPSWRFNVPAAQDMYVTNPVEFYALTQGFDVWSHTLMLEVRARLPGRLEAFADAEEWLRVAIQQPVLYQVGYVDPRFNAPGQKLELFYRAGVRFHPWEGQRHRVSLSVTNKQIEAGTRVTDAVWVRFYPDDLLWLVTMDAFL
jgi:hypothetical protein